MMAAAAAAAASRVCLPRRHSITCALPSGAAAASVSAWQARTRSAPAAARRHSGQARVAAAAAAGTGADGARSPEAKEEMSGCVLMCSELFSKEYLFVMPAIQRPYDWDESDAQLLLEDLLSALGPQMTNVR